MPETLINIALLAYLVLSIRSFNLLSFLKVFLLMHVAGEILFKDFWEAVSTFAFMTNVTDDMRAFGNALLLGLVVLGDVGYWLGTRLFARPRLRFVAVEAGRFVSPSYYLWVGLGIKALLFVYLLAAKGVNMLSMQPEDAVGIFGIMEIAEMLIPFGLALRRLSSDGRRGVITDFVLLLALGFFSHSKAMVINYLLGYCVTYLMIHGWQSLRQQTFNARIVLVLLGIVVAVGIKSQQRSASGAVSLTSEEVVVNAVGGASARLMGGIHRTYLTIMDEIVRRNQPPLGGKYHAQALYLFVPRAIWADKPRSAAEDLYYYLDITEEDPGSAYAVNPFGVMIFDFGLPLGLVATLLFGMVLALIEKVLFQNYLRNPSHLAAKISSIFGVYLWLSSVNLLAEAGFPLVVTRMIISGGGFMAIHLLYVLYLNRPKPARLSEG